MAIHELAGKKAPYELLTDIPKLITAYYSEKPDASVVSQRVSFGTSGHRGVSTALSFNELHIMAITQAVCEYRTSKGITGPLFLGADTHALSNPAQVTAIEVLAANGITFMYQKGFGPIPTPGVSHAILTYNKNRTEGVSDGIVITPSHNPPDAGGFKYNPPNGGPADSDVTGVIEKRANELLKDGCKDVKRVTLKQALNLGTSVEYDYITPYVDDLQNIIHMDRIAKSDLRIGVDPMGGASIDYWKPIGERYGINFEIVNPRLDPAFGFMCVDHDGKIRMDCSSKYAMASLIDLKDRFDIAFGNDPDSDRHGIVTKTGLMNPNHYLAASIGYLFNNRPDWPENAAIGKTLVSSAIIDRLAKGMNLNLKEVPVGFKWFVNGLIDSSFGFAGEESAGASFLRKDGGVWTTDKDGIIMDLLAAEMMVETGKSPSEHYSDMVEKYGDPVYERIDVASTIEEKEVLKNLSPSQVKADTMAGEKIVEKLTKAPGNGAAIGGLKVVTENGWFAARPSGTENIYKIYAESFKGSDHLKQIQDEATQIVADALK
ncbi:MAG: alpha-D-glucose phosphate-specific phosphoglucomutase [Deltaproteobacteria bacterium]|nr:alpha-D-glucose phosphate-specific phosphoglucomutase [Deltaproteobacteria bacterium]